MAMNTVLLTPRKSQTKQFRLLHPKTVSSVAEIRAFLQIVNKETLWISDDERKTIQLLRSVSWPTKRLGSAVLLFRPRPDLFPALRKCFDPIVFGADVGFLPAEQLAEVLTAENRRDLFIGGTVDLETETITLWRGDLDSIVVPFSAFPISGDGIAPTFEQFSVTDYGQTIQLGSYESAADVILYEFDEEYRRRIKKQRQENEQGLGASIRRLRKQRGLRREDFKPLSAKTLARIEQGLVNSLHEKSLAIIAKILGVRPDQLASY